MTADTEARVRITEHEKLCAERWKRANKSIDGLYKRLWWFLSIILTAQGAAILMLIRMLVGE